MNGKETLSAKILSSSDRIGAIEVILRSIEVISLLSKRFFNQNLQIYNFITILNYFSVLSVI